MSPVVQLALMRSPLTEPILDGRVGIDGVDLRPVEATSMDACSRAMTELRYDAAEMSLATYLRARVVEGLPLVAVPVFPGRRFVQPLVRCAPGSGIRTPADLAGRRVAVAQYWMTSAVWHRGVLASEYGVDTATIGWRTTTGERLPGLPSPGVVRVEGATPLDLLRSGEVDCVLLPRLRPGAEAIGVAPFDDLPREQVDYFTRTGVFPIMHVLVLAEPVADRHAGLAARLVELFTAAKALAEAPSPVVGLSPVEATRSLGADPWVDGLAPNLTALDTFLAYARQQGLVDGVVPARDLFAVTE